MSQPSASLKAFMAHLIDYAGLFPPAKLPLTEAIQNYTRYRREADAEMLARFIIPATRLADLTALTEAGQIDFADRPPFRFSILGRGGATAEEFMDGLRADLPVVHTFCQQHRPNVELDVFETRLPTEPLSTVDLEKLFITATGLITSTQPMRLFCEVPPTGDWATWQKRATYAIEAIAAYNHHHTDAPVGFKLRCGGVEATAFPPPEEVAFALAACREAQVTLKGTAGLHHPLRHFDGTVQTKMHGFINVFGAGILAHIHGLAPDDIEAILIEEEPGHFTFTGDTFAWRHLKATTSEIAAVRQTALVSYGSCSFDEPREDLRALGWL